MIGRMLDRRVWASVALASLWTSGAWAQMPPITETIDFEGYDRKATKIAREMYGDQFAFVEGKAFWLIEESEIDPQQIAVKMGPPNCEPSCSIGVLFHTDGAWAEVWRRTADQIRIGEVGPDGLKSIIDENDREWIWQNGEYFPLPRGPVLASREPTELELENAVDFALERLNLPADMDLPHLGASDFDLKDGGGTAVYLSGPACQGINGACPVVFLDKNKKPVGLVRAMGSDLRPGVGTDSAGYTRVEAATMEGVAILSPSRREGFGGIRPQPITRAGEPREVADESSKTASDAPEGDAS